MTDASEWTGRVGDTWAGEWARTDRSFGALTARLLDPAALGAFSSLLDIGCGAGELIARLADAHPEACLTGLDISDNLLEVARVRCGGSANARFVRADAATWHADAANRPDRLLSRHGVMFFGDPVAAFSNLRAQTAAGALLRFSCFCSREANGWVGALAAAFPEAPPPADPDAPGPFAFGDEQRVVSLLAQAGWQDIICEPVDYGMVASDETSDAGEAAADALTYFRRIGPAARALATLPREDRATAEARMLAILAEFFDGRRIAMPAAAWLVTARAD